MWLLIGLLAGCGDGRVDDTGAFAEVEPTQPQGGVVQGSDTSDRAPMVLQVGSGDVAYSPLQDGDHVTMVHGNQGGWHVSMSGAVEQCGQVVVVRGDITHVASGMQIAGGQPDQTVALSGWDIAGQNGSFAGYRVVFSDLVSWSADKRYCEFAGEELELCALVEDVQSRSRWVTDCVRVIADLDPRDVQTCAAAS